MSVIWQKQPSRSRLYASDALKHAPKLPVFARSANLCVWFLLNFDIKKRAELIFMFWRRVWGENQEHLSKGRKRALHFTLSSCMTPGNQHMVSDVPSRTVIDTNLRQITRVGWGSFLRINHFPLPPWQKWPILNARNFGKNKIPFNFWDMHLTASLAIGWEKK